VKDMKNRKGFTLMELLVVIGIIGLLAVFLVPNLLGAKDRAKETAVKGVMHSIQLAVEAYEMTNLVYPLDNNLPLESLCRNYLMAGGFIASVPKNPFTGIEYKDADVAGKVIYNLDQVKGVYTLTGYNRSGISKIQELTNL
jgi:general secretion pathway protein G